MPRTDDEHWYEHVPKLVKTSHKDTIILLWNQQVQTDKTIPNNILNIKICDNEIGKRMLICSAISGDCNMIKRGVEKIIRMKISAEIRRRCNVKANSDTSNKMDNWNYLKIIQ